VGPLTSRSLLDFDASIVVGTLFIFVADLERGVSDCRVVEIRSWKRVKNFDLVGKVLVS